MSQRVIVSPHAVARLRERKPDLQTGDAIGHIFHDVQEAFRQGWTSKRVPRWAVADGRDRRRPEKGRVVRYAWNEALSACYVLVWADSVGDGRRSWIVVTTLAAAEVVAA